VDLNFDGNFTECGNPSRPGIKPIRDYLESLPYAPIRSANWVTFI